MSVVFYSLFCSWQLSKFKDGGLKHFCWYLEGNMLWLGALSSRSDVVCEVRRVRWPSVLNVYTFKNCFHIWPWSGEFKSCGKRTTETNTEIEENSGEPQADEDRDGCQKGREEKESKSRVRFSPADDSGRQRCTLERCMKIICIKSFTVMNFCWHIREQKCDGHYLWPLEKEHSTLTPFISALHCYEAHNRRGQSCISSILWGPA